MFHLGMWRERMRDALAAAVDGREHRISGTADEINDAELAGGIGTPLTDAASRADHLLTEVGELFELVGDKPVRWFTAATAADAVLRNSFSHPHVHICEYLLENGDAPHARKLLDEALSELEKLPAPDYVTAVLARLRSDPRLQDPVSG